MPRVKTGGRQPGSKNRVTESMRKDILSVYRKLGGQKFLLSWARENETEYVKQCLARVMPAMPRQALDEQEDAEFILPYDPRGIDAQRAFAMRIAFILARHEASSDTPVTIIDTPAPVQAPLPPEPPPLPRPTYTIPTDLHDQEVVAETDTESPQTYRGSPAEQGRSHTRPDVIDQRRQAHDDYVARLAARHRRSLL